jgi:hypothetical protein
MPQAPKQIISRCHHRDKTNTFSTTECTENTEIKPMRWISLPEAISYPAGGVLCSALALRGWLYGCCGAKTTACSLTKARSHGGEGQKHGNKTSAVDFFSCGKSYTA